MSQATDLPVIHLLPGKDKPVRQRHPWIFSGAIARTQGELTPGGLADVCDARGEWLARGYVNPR
jgi:23S rRNA (cytosine1962-C5)-methyltransferase